MPIGELAKNISSAHQATRPYRVTRQGQMVPAFDKVAFSCPVLEPTGPLHTQFGYHIIRVLNRNQQQGLLREGLEL